MNILFAASEAMPLAKTGGLGDVAGALPKAIRDKGADIRVILPKYSSVPALYADRFRRKAVYTVRMGWREQACGLLEAEIDGLRFYLIENDDYFKREGLYGYEDEAERFVFFCLAVIGALPHLAFHPDIIHCNDWQTGLIPLLLKHQAAENTQLRNIRTVFTIHNLQYQGIFPQEVLSDLLTALPELFTVDGFEFYGEGNCMKAGITYADKLTTVSHTYAEEIVTDEGGALLGALLRHRANDLVGIVNGIDTVSFDPMNDPAISSPYRNSLARKLPNKQALQEELGLVQSEDTAVIGIVSRLTEQKGLDLLEAVLKELLAEQLQLVVLGVGDARYERLFANAQNDYPGKVAVRFVHDEELARRIYAGADMFLMPSRFEPCGLSQLIALHYRTIPIVRSTGGLKDTVFPFNHSTGSGNGLSFAAYDPEELLIAVRDALALYENKLLWKKIVENCTRGDYSWNRSAARYMELYRQLLLQRKGNE
ncbi:glycogen synthase GlgA [Paenibacillaceae bacterium]|nr:glycogen synthase GlgA [Paenibacillaceae bacterium]